MSKIKSYLIKFVSLMLSLAVLHGFTSAAYAQPTPNTITYTVAPGDTFHTLAQRFSTTASGIASLNPSVNPENLTVGVKVKITPGSDAILYTVRKGDTLGKIAGKYNTSIRSVADKNFLRNPDRLIVGDILSIPRIYRFPAEFEPQQAIWLQWPSEVYNSGSSPVNAVSARIIKTLAPYVQVNLMVKNNAETAQAKRLITAGGFSDSNVKYYVIDHYSIWARDVGPIFLKDNVGELGIPDFKFNNYGRDGNSVYVNTENQINNSIAQQFGIRMIDTNLVSEGGAIEQNGKGTIMVTASVALNRNPGMTLQQIENEYKRVLGVSKVIWLKKGLVGDDRITTGHINEIARFADANTILLAQVLPGDRNISQASQEDNLRMEENYGILKNATDPNGKPFRIIRVPLPATMYTKAGKTETPPVYSYMNYAVTNGAVIMQTYWKAGQPDTLKATENQVRSILQSAYPGRKIVGVDAESVNLRWGGGIHCMTQHMPAK